MSNAVALKSENTKPSFTPEQEKLLLDTVAKGASPDEFKLFVHRAHAMGINPLVPGQIHFVKYGNSPGSIIIGIEGFRSIAQRTGMLAGITRKAMHDANGRLIGAYAEVHRKDWTHPAREEVLLSEYQGTSPIWRQKPETMIKKVAECAALRMAFPNDLGGVYSDEEADSMNDGGVRPDAYGQPTEADGAIDGPYRIDFGQYAARSIDEVCRAIGKDGLVAEIEKREDELSGKKKTSLDLLKPGMIAKVQRFIDEASDYVVKLEKGEPIDAEVVDDEPSAFEQSAGGSLFSKPKMSREDLGKEIFVEMKRLKMNNSAVSKITQEKFGKGPAELTFEEMESLSETLKGESQ